MGDRERLLEDREGLLVDWEALLKLKSFRATFIDFRSFLAQIHNLDKAANLRFQTLLAFPCEIIFNTTEL